MKILKNCCLIAGTALLLAALFLVLYNLHEDRQGGAQAGAVLSALRSDIPEFPPETAVPDVGTYDLYAGYEEPKIPEMETAEIDGHYYIGCITFPEFGIELPVMEDWGYPELKIAPCRYTGSLYTGNLIIAGHNYTSHFGKIGRLSPGSELIFTDVKGVQYFYTVCELEQLPGTATEEMQLGGAVNWELTLFTCTLNGQNRITVRAERNKSKAGI